LKLSNKQLMVSFYATTCKTDYLQILYKFCKNWISVPNIMHQLTLSLHCNHWKIQNSSDSQDALNSTCRSANDGNGNGAKPMTSVFYDVIRLEAVRGGLNVPIEGYFWRFWGNLNPKILSAIVWTPKRHFLMSQRVFRAIVRQNPCTGHFSKRVREKNKNKKRHYFTYFARHSLTADWHKFWVMCLSRRCNQLCKVLS